ncbi:hypothetical protein LCGC14_2671390 [marine sediment metagenome]|uniref:Uncharacterized protein n=1 Tax=marine sediment metagenome TaxID=412755 RepID=A0A0F9ABF7_9ZZZZ
MVCAEFTGIGSVADLLVWPTVCNYWFYLIVFATIFITLSLILYNKQKDDEVKGDLISSMGVSAIAILFLSLIGTLIKNSEGIPMVQQDVFIYIFAMSIIFILLWFFKK